MMERLKELLPLWTVLAFFAAGFGALGSISPQGTPFENHVATLRMVCYGAVVVCLVVGVLALVLEQLRTFSKYLGRGIRASATFVCENPVLVASLVTISLLLWRLFDLGLDPALFAIVPLLVVACIALTVGLIRFLAMTCPSFLGLPARAEGTKETPAVPEGLWCYDFIEHFDDPTTIKDYSAGTFPIQVMRQAASMGEVKPAIFAHPGEHADTILSYQVENIPGHVGQVQLEFFTGILDIRRDEKTGQLQEVSQFHAVPGNRIRFEIWVNEGRVFEEERRAVGWSEFKQVRELEPFNNRLVVSFRTDAMGDPRWNWAAWGEPKLVEVKPTSSAAG